MVDFNSGDGLHLHGCHPNKKLRNILSTLTLVENRDIQFEFEEWKIGECSNFSESYNKFVQNKFESSFTANYKIQKHLIDTASDGSIHFKFEDANDILRTDTSLTFNYNYNIKHYSWR